MRVRKLSESGGVSIDGIDLSQPIASGVAAELLRLYDEEGLLAIRGQQLTMEQLAAAAEPFGGSEVHVLLGDQDTGIASVSLISTRGNSGTVEPIDLNANLGRIDWHTDQAYVVAPNRGKLLYAVTIPEEGGMTGFIDGERTYTALSDEMKAKVEDLHVVHSWRHAQDTISLNRGFYNNGDTRLAPDRYPDIAYPLVVKHPRTGRRCLNAPPLWAAGIVELPGAEGKVLLEELLVHLRQPCFAYWHRYLPGDVVAWDNWRFLHAASGTPARHVRTLWSTVIRGGPAIGMPLSYLEST